MAVRNQNWYDLNESRPYPLDDTATGLSDAGERLPSGLIADLHLRFPAAAGTRAWLGAVTVTPTLVTVTILAADSVNSVGNFTPLAVASFTKAVVPRRQYPLDPQYTGVGGWIVFGDDIFTENWSGKFSTPAQSLLQPVTAKFYQALPIPSVGSRNNANPLTGIVRLQSGTDIEVVKECREIPNYEPGSPAEQCNELNAALRDVIVFRLRATRPAGAGVGVEDFNVFERYIGPCGSRPESLNCGDPTPIESISGVLPDCDGNITIDFSGCATVSEVTEEATLDSDGEIEAIDDACGFVIDCGLGLTDACITPDRLPSSDGKLPNDYDDLCESVTEISITLGPEEEEDPGSAVLDEESASVAEEPSLPFSTVFPNSGDVASNFETAEGQFAFESAGEYGSLGASSSAMKNVALYKDEFLAAYRQLQATLTMRSSAGVIHNGGVIMDYRLVSGSTTRYQYWLADVDYSGSFLGYPMFRIAFFNGQNYTNYLSVPLAGQLVLDAQYQITFSAWPNLNLENRHWLEATLVKLPSTEIASIGPLSVPNFAADVGKFGLQAHRSITAFHSFNLSNL